MKNHLYFVRLSVAIIIFLQLGSIAHCQTLLNENFSYPSGSALTANGWKAHDDPGTNPVLVSSAGLVFPGYILSDIDLCAYLANSGEDLNKSFTSITSGTVFCAFMLKIEAVSNGYFFHLSNSSISSYRGRVYLKGSGSTFTIGLSKGAENPVYNSGTSLATATVYLVVLKYSIIEGTANDEVSLYIVDSPIPVTEPLVPSIGPLTDAGQTDLANISAVALRQYSSTQKILVDGIRVATKWEDAVGMSTNITGVSEIKNPVLFPVPVQEELTINNIGSFNNLEIFNIEGRKVFTAEINGNETIKLPIGNLSKGIYILRLNNKRIYKTMRFIKS